MKHNPFIAVHYEVEDLPTPKCIIVIGIPVVDNHTEYIDAKY